MPDRGGVTANHYNHVHVSFVKSNIKNYRQLTDEIDSKLVVYFYIKKLNNTFDSDTISL